MHEYEIHDEDFTCQGCGFWVDIIFHCGGCGEALCSECDFLHQGGDCENKE